ncbi:sensor histidine kinase [Nodularia sphaerocarpa]|uniref:sensor histidine kinase n=1 Tax=Nodularia sphaerocarpa TaxID=137816 RepID=UPI001EFBAE3A|nr:sensor histidine kinase [Nodularia sphaerocarpa]MDB9372967.1 sensor histidine kinase [Nodularia sphaerocarpa CS-585]MDB9379064.1 sensor histidine kinase [Nodularia sphaerocarpa CS-585A2]ULP71706.1 Autoinducer 2 sensor kinase/phosphatase LuxQ [Nodularia sphaerocarpa UHCC 0038]
MDFSLLLAENADSILQEWVAAVLQDRKIESAEDLPYTAIQNHLPDVLKAMVTVLSKSQSSDIQSIITASWDHGILRAKQGFDPAEITHEYHLLREVIFDTLESQLLKGTPSEIIRSMRLIDAVIDEAIAQCVHSYIGERLEEFKHLYSSLVLHNQQLNRLVLANQEHISQLAHDLKHPLSSIIGYSDLFLRQQRKKPELKDNYANIEHIERVLRNGRQLLRLINDVLEISRFDAGQTKLNPVLINVRELIDSICEMFQPLADEKKLQVIVDYDSIPEKVVTDEYQLQQIMTNLVSNAIRYTESGTVAIQCHLLDHNQWSIAVSDTGIGITPENQSQIFEPYFRANSGNRSYLPDSTGLGLAIVTRLVKLLQGKIDLVSEVGVGSTFTVTMPLELE